MGISSASLKYAEALRPLFGYGLRLRVLLLNLATFCTCEVVYDLGLKEMRVLVELVRVLEGIAWV